MEPEPQEPRLRHLLARQVERADNNRLIRVVRLERLRRQNHLQEFFLFPIVCLKEPRRLFNSRAVQVEVRALFIMPVPAILWLNQVEVEAEAVLSLFQLLRSLEQELYGREGGARERDWFQPGLRRLADQAEVAEDSFIYGIIPQQDGLEHYRLSAGINL